MQTADLVKFSEDLVLKSTKYIFISAFPQILNIKMSHPMQLSLSE
jgi:hypothetical protein